MNVLEFKMSQLKRHSQDMKNGKNLAATFAFRDE